MLVVTVVACDSSSVGAAAASVGGIEVFLDAIGVDVTGAAIAVAAVAVVADVVALAAADTEVLPILCSQKGVCTHRNSGVVGSAGAKLQSRVGVTPRA